MEYCALSNFPSLVMRASALNLVWSLTVDTKYLSFSLGSGWAQPPTTSRRGFDNHYLNQIINSWYEIKTLICFTKLFENRSEPSDYSISSVSYLFLRSDLSDIIGIEKHLSQLFVISHYAILSYYCCSSGMIPFVFIVSHEYSIRHLYNFTRVGAEACR